MLKREERQQMLQKLVFDKYYLSPITDEWTNLLDKYRDFEIKKCNKEIENLGDDTTRKEVLEYRKYTLQNASYHDLQNDYHLKVEKHLESCVTEDYESTFNYEAFFKLILGE